MDPGPQKESNTAGRGRKRREKEKEAKGTKKVEGAGQRERLEMTEIQAEGRRRLRFLKLCKITARLVGN